MSEISGDQEIKLIGYYTNGESRVDPLSDLKTTFGNDIEFANQERWAFIISSVYFSRKTKTMVKVKDFDWYPVIRVYINLFGGLRDNLMLPGVKENVTRVEMISK